MPWKWDPTRPHDVQISVTPSGNEQNAVEIVWGDQPAETRIVRRDDAGKLLRELAKQVQALGYALDT